MPAFRPVIAGLLVAAALVPAAAPGASAPRRPSAHALLSSRELWATIDVCNPPDQAHTVGVRGSMPGDRQPGDHMYMSFRLQYMNASRHWVDLANGSGPVLIAIGSGATARQGGSSFELKPHRPAVTLRGVVEFQWRQGRTVILSTTRPTTAGHRSLAGADPADYSAATCVMH
jgi:hypothetical protein